MRFALVTETYPPEVNGVALTVRCLEQGLRARGHAVTVVRPGCLQAAPDADTLVVRGLPLPRYPGLQFGAPAGRALATAWTRDRPHAAYIATEGPLGWSALRVARRLGIPVATGFHTRFDLYLADYGLGLLQGAAFEWMRRFHRAADATVVPTQELQAFLATRGFGRALRLARAVDTSAFHPAHRDPALRAEWGVRDDVPVVIHVGRIAPEKNLALVVSAFRSLQARRPDARCVWVGDGPARAGLEREHPDFIFAGVRRGHDLARHFASADLFLFASRSETFGNVTLEAMASGVPTVAFDRGAAREHLRDGVHGAAIVDGDQAAFEAAAARIGSDAVGRARMGTAAREAVAHLHPARVAADFEAILRMLVLEGADARRAAA